MSTKKRINRNKIILIVAVTLIVAVGLFGYVYFSGKSDKNNTECEKARIVNGVVEEADVACLGR